MLEELDKKKEPLTLAVGLSTQMEGTIKLKFTVENCFYLLFSQAVHYHSEPAISPLPQTMDEAGAQLKS